MRDRDTLRALLGMKEQVVESSTAGGGLIVYG